MKMRSRHSWLFTLSVLFLLALGIGAAAILSGRIWGHSQLYALQTAGHSFEGQGNASTNATPFSMTTYHALQQNQQIFSNVVAYAPLGSSKAIAQARNRTEEATGELVSGNFFSVLRVKMRVGRAFRPADSAYHMPVVVLGLDLWTKLFHRDPGALGQIVYINGIPFAIFGVAAEGFTGVDPSRPVDFWIPLESRRQLPDAVPEAELHVGLMTQLVRGVDASHAAALVAPLAQTEPGSAMKISLVPVKGIVGTRE